MNSWFGGAVLAAMVVLTAAPAAAQVTTPEMIRNTRLVSANGNCYVQITFVSGRVRLIACDDLDEADLDEFDDDEWEDFCEYARLYLSRAQWEEYCQLQYAPFVSLARTGGSVAFSGVRLHLDGSYLGTGTTQRGFLATEIGGELLNPAYTLDYGLSGYKAGFGLQADVQLGDLSPFRFYGDLEFGGLSGSGSTSGQQLDNLGITSVGDMPGVFVNSPTDVLGTEFDVERRFGSLSLRFGVPLGMGHYDFDGGGQGSGIAGLDYQIFGLFGGRFGGLGQTETTSIRTSTPAFGLGALSDIAYETSFDGMFGGFQAGLGLDKRLPLVNSDLTIEETFTLLAGYDFYRFRIEDSINAQGLGGALDYASSNSFDVTAGVPTLELQGSIGIGDGKWYVGVRGGVFAGLQPALDYGRPDSTAGGDPLQPTLELQPSAGWELGADLRFRF